MNLRDTIAWLTSAKRNNPGGWKPVELGHWYDWVTALDEPEFLIDHTILSDACLMMTGPATIGFKSWTSFLLAEIIACGGSYEGLTASNRDGLPVLILEEEGPRKPTASRFEMIAKGCNLDWPKARKNILMSHRLGIKLDDPKWSNAISKSVEDEGVKFVVIDTLAKTMQGDENSAQAIGKAM
jgi:RecA-family ATPase